MSGIGGASRIAPEKGVEVNLIKAAARRLLGQRLQPAATVRLRDKIVTMLFSQDDEPYPPSDRLIQLAAQLIGLAHVTSLNEIAAGLSSIPPYYAAWPGEHYKLLAALMQACSRRPSWR